MRREEDKIYFKWGITAVCVIIICLLFYFLLDKLDQVSIGFHSAMGILKPFIYGAVLAYLLAPACNRLENWFKKWSHGKTPRLCSGISILISVALTVLVISLIVLIIVPNTLKSLVSLMNTLPGQINKASDKIEAMLADDPELKNWWESIVKQISDTIVNWRENGIMPLVKSVLSGTATYVTGFLTLLKNLLVSLVIAVYLLAARKKFAAQAKLFLHGVCPEKWVKAVDLEMRYADRMFNGFFIGKLFDSAIVGVLCFAGCLIFGFSPAPLISVIVGVTNIIPFFGPFIGAIPCALLLLLNDPLQSLMFVIFILVLQQLDGNVIGPRILGNTTGLSGFWVMFAILLFGGLWGISGMIVGVPLFAVIYDVSRAVIYRGLQKRGKDEMVEEYRKKYHPELNAAPKAVPHAGLIGKWLGNRKKNNTGM